jgi:hypothetical protein
VSGKVREFYAKLVARRHPSVDLYVHRFVEEADSGAAGSLMTRCRRSINVQNIWTRPTKDVVGADRLSGPGVLWLVRSLRDCTIATRGRGFGKRQRSLRQFVEIWLVGKIAAKITVFIMGRFAHVTINLV